jgi:hypothetical protein
VPQGAAADVGLRDRPHLDRGLDARRDAQLLQDVLKPQGVDDRPQHAHVIGLGPLDAQLLDVPAPQHVAAAHHHTQLDARTVNLSELRPDPTHRVEIKAKVPVPGQHLPGELQQDPLVPRHRNPSSTEQKSRRKLPACNKNPARRKESSTPDPSF